MNKVKSLFRKITRFIIDLTAYFFAFCFVVTGCALIKDSVFGAIVTILFAFFISPLRRKLLEKFGFKLKKKFTVIIGALLFVVCMYHIGSSNPTTDVVSENQNEIVSVDTLEENFEIEDVSALAENNPVETLENQLEESVSEGEAVSEKEIAVSEIDVSKIEENKIEVDEEVAEQSKSTDIEQKPAEASVQDEVPIESNLAVHFIDVGQGDATLFICDGEAMLLDAGNTNSGTSIQLYLKKRGIDKLKYLILTHPDEDHIGGADVIITKYGIDNVFMTDYEKDTKAYEEVINALEYRWMKWSTPSVGSTYSLGGATFTVIAPNRSYSDPNEASMGILVTHGNNKFLFTGDAEGEAESDIVRNGINLDCNVFHAGHHGSRTSNSSSLLKAATPEFVVVSCGEDNSYGHPHAGPMNDFRSMGAKLFRTDEQGTIVAESDGANLTWNMSPTDSWKAGESTENSQSSQSKPAPTPVPTPTPQPEPEPTPQPAGSNFAVNGKNGKIHIVGACPATGTGKSSMKEPVYFGTFEEAEAYSIQYHPGQDKRKCGNCY